LDDLPEDIVGLVFGPSSNTEFSFTVNPDNIPKFGEYVMAENRDGEKVLGIVKEIVNFNKLIMDEGYSFSYVLKNLSVSEKLLKMNDVVVATARVLGVVKNETEIDIQPNRVPIKPSSPVRLASDEILKEIFKGGHGYIEVGCLLARNSISVGLNVKELVLRHFAILAVTGGGKSNTAAVLINELVKKMSGTVILIDPHGEYATYRFEDGKERDKVVLPAGIRPETLEPWEFASLVGVSRDASIQRLHLERMFTTALHENKSGKELVERILELTDDWINSAGNEVEYFDIRGSQNTARIDRQDINSLSRVREYVTAFYRTYGDLLTQNDLLANIKPGHLNVVNLSGFDENQMKIIVAYLLRNILLGRIAYIRGDLETKKRWENICPAVKAPVLVVVEEGHIFAPKGEYNDVVRWMSRIAREGRKFGVGLGIISQRPKKLNDDVLSQCNTKIILRIVEPTDQRYVQQASEQISEDLLKDIAALGKGEAVIVGPAIKIPAAVKIRKFQGSYGGQDIEVVEEWSRIKRDQKDFDVNLEELAR